MQCFFLGIASNLTLCVAMYLLYSVNSYHPSEHQQINKFTYLQSLCNVCTWCFLDFSCRETLMVTFDLLSGSTRKNYWMDFHQNVCM